METPYFIGRLVWAQPVIGHSQSDEGKIEQKVQISTKCFTILQFAFFILPPSFHWS
jgi:hypothetical protein